MLRLRKARFACRTLTYMTTLSAHFDGQKIQLDEPYKLAENARLVVVVLDGVENEQRDEWSRLAAQHLARGCGEAEPEYTASDLRNSSVSGSF